LITGGRRNSTFSPLFKLELIPMTENGFVKIIEREKEVHLLIMEAKGNLLKIPFPKKEKNKID
jgi:hypothetical protein